MVYRIRGIERDVRVAMDENSRHEALLREEDTDTLTLTEIIRSKIAEAARIVVRAAPRHLLDGGVPFGDAIHWERDFSGWTLLPDDFMRMLVFRMSDWERPVYEAITESDARYALQHSRYKGIRGNPQKPVVAIVRRNEGLVLELYSCHSESSTVSQALYLPIPKIDRDGGIEIPEPCYEAVVYETASLVSASIGQRELSTTMSELSNQLLV